MITGTIVCLRVTQDNFQFRTHRGLDKFTPTGCDTGNQARAGEASKVRGLAAIVAVPVRYADQAHRCVGTPLGNQYACENKGY